MIETRNLGRTFGHREAVTDLSLSLGPGKTLALLGPNGAGKTTTIRMLTGLLSPSTGMAVVAGFDVVRNPDQVRPIVGLMTDDPGLYGGMTLVDYLNFFGGLYRMEPASLRLRRNRLVEQFDLSGYRGVQLRSLSKGNRQKVALVRSLLHDPRVLFLDEPTANLDPEATVGVRDLISQLKSEGRTIVLCTHDLDEAERLADSVLIMDRGRTVFTGSARQANFTRFVLTVRRSSQVASAETVAGIAGEWQWEADVVRFVYESDKPEADNPRIVADCVGIGLEVMALEPQTHSLESLYLKVVGGAKGRASS